MKKNPELKAVKKRNGRWAVKKRNGGFVKGDDKVSFLVENNLIKVQAKKEAPAAEAE